MPGSIDAFMLLAASSHFVGTMTETFVQKAIFCAEDDARRKKAPLLPGFPFYRWKHGPYSKEVANTCQALAYRGFMDAKGGPISARGRDLVAEIRREIARFPLAERALADVDGYARRYAAMNLQAVLAEVYARPFGATTIGNVSSGTDLIVPSPFGLACDGELEELSDLIAWRLTQSDAEERVERDSPLASDERASRFLGRLLA
jgi:hypothetical protein